MKIMNYIINKNRKMFKNKKNKVEGINKIMAKIQINKYKNL